MSANSGLPSFQSDWWLCMPEPLSPKSGFGMNVAVLPCWRATFLTMYLYHDLVGHLQRLEPHVDLALAAGRDLVVVDLDGMPSRSSVSTISVRRSCSVSFGAGGK